MDQDNRLSSAIESVVGFLSEDPLTIPSNVQAGVPRSRRADRDYLGVLAGRESVDRSYRRFLHPSNRWPSFGGYSYVGGDPVASRDPLGLYTFTPQTPGCDVIPKCLETPWTRKCCDNHDDCYTAYGCSGWSWFSLNPYDPCRICNVAVTLCFLAAPFPLMTDQPQPPPQVWPW